jgi:hypothetical protein
MPFWGSPGITSPQNLKPYSLSLHHITTPLLTLKIVEINITLRTKFYLFETNGGG